MADLSHARYRPTRDAPAAPAVWRDVVLAPWLFLGIGLAGLVDGIVFHQILQWHNMLSAVVPPTDSDSLRFNLLADGMFHAAAVLVTLLGLALLWRAVRSGRANRMTATGAFGGLLGGFGLFNLVEGLVNHHFLQLHNVREVADPTPWNLGFLLLAGLLPLALGALLRQRAIRNAALDAARTPVADEVHAVRDDEVRAPVLRETSAVHAVPASQGMEARTAPLGRVEPRAVATGHLIQVMLPLKVEGRAVDPRAFEAVKSELAARFGGMTAYTRSPAEGRWLGGAVPMYDDLVVFEVMTPELDRDWWARYRSELEQAFRQQAIVVRSQPVQLL